MSKEVMALDLHLDLGKAASLPNIETDDESKPYNALALYGSSGNLYGKLYEILCIIYYRNHCKHLRQAKAAGEVCVQTRETPVISIFV